MRFIWISTWKDIGRLRRDPFALLMWMAIPLILGVLLNAVFGGGTVTPQGRLLVTDEDDTFVSNVLASAFSREPLSKMVLVEKVGREEGRARIDRGDGSAFLIIPKGFADAALNNQPFHLELFTNPAQRILPNIIQGVLSIMVEGEFYLQQVAGDQLRMFQRGSVQGKTAPTDVQVAVVSVSINRLVSSLRTYLIPPVITLSTTVTRENVPRKSFAAIFYPPMMFMAILFLASSLAADIWKERNAGALRRLCGTPARLSAFLAGRVVFVAMVLLLVAMVGIVVAHGMAGVPMASIPGAVLWLMLSGTVFFLLFLLLTMQASTQRGANVLANLVIFPLAMLGGCFFPFESMPEWMVRIGTKTPNGWAVVQFNAIVDGSVHAQALLTAAALLTLVSVLAFLLVLRKLRRGFAL
jgi:ABC-type multidrug transport system permease subunit